MHLIRCGVLASALLVGSAAVVYAQNYQDSVGAVPPVLRALTLGMTRADVERLVPEAKPLGASTDAKSALFVYFKEPETWDSAMLEFVGGRLEGINLLIGATKRSDLFQRSEKTLRVILDRNGTEYRLLIAINSALHPVPVYWWSKQGFSVFAVGPAVAVTSSGREAFPADPSLRVGIVRTDRPVQDLVRVATPDETRDALFKAISPISR